MTEKALEMHLINLDGLLLPNDDLQSHVVQVKDKLRLGHTWLGSCDDIISFWCSLPSERSLNVSDEEIARKYHLSSDVLDVLFGKVPTTPPEISFPDKDQDIISAKQALYELQWSKEKHYRSGSVPFFLAEGLRAYGLKDKKFVLGSLSIANDITYDLFLDLYKQQRKITINDGGYEQEQNACIVSLKKYRRIHNLWEKLLDEKKLVDAPDGALKLDTREEFFSDSRFRVFAPKNHDLLIKKLRCKTHSGLPVFGGPRHYELSQYL
ncbi:MAG: hypothetical protein Q7K43_03265, partial [Candidatus Woesearchaeota archaeon]|nr:hypothetical protein [Candidatus Woesearchaeota archaeon]